MEVCLSLYVRQEGTMEKEKKPGITIDETVLKSKKKVEKIQGLLYDAQEEWLLNNMLAMENIIKIKQLLDERNQKSNFIILHYEDILNEKKMGGLKEFCKEMLPSSKNCDLIDSSVNNEENNILEVTDELHRNRVNEEALHMIMSEKVVYLYEKLVQLSYWNE